MDLKTWILENFKAQPQPQVSQLPAKNVNGAGNAKKKGGAKKGKR